MTPGPSESGGAGPSERRVVTVLFADIAGFTAMAERLDPETVTDAMNVIFALLGAEVEAVGGTVDKVIGDNLMALFGAPVAHEDDALRAVRAARAMQRGIAAQQSDLQRTLGGAVRLRIGIHTGQVVWGAVGPPGQTRPTVMGDTVNLASRLQRASPEGGVVVSEAVWRQVRAHYEGTAWEPLAVRGRADAVAVYEITGDRTGAEPLERPPFVDRHEELDQLDDLFARATRGRAQVAIITGDPGIGKTRLVEEFLSRLAGDISILSTTCLPYGGQSLSPLSDLFRQFAGLSGPVTLQDVEARVAMGERTAQAAVILSRLFNLVEIPSGTDVSQETALLVAAEAIRGMMRRATVVWIEDLQWADTGTREVLPFVVERLGETPLLLIGTIRTGEAPPVWGRRTSVRTLPLDPLSADDAAALIAGILGERLPATVEHALVAKAAGNPFYLSEMLATLRGRGILALDDRGRWRVTGSVEDVLPDTVHAAVLARLDRLAPDLRALVQRASVVGTVFRQSLVAALGREVDIAGALGQLEDAGLIRRADPLAPDPEYAFAHPLLREVAYASLLTKHQTGLHREIAEMTERLYPEARDEQAKAIATHFVQAGDPQRALPYLVTAGERAARQYATGEAIQLLEQARRLAEDAGHAELCVPACELLGDLYLHVHERGPKDWRSVWEFVYAHVDPAADPIRRARAAIRIAHALFHENRAGETGPYLDEAEMLIPAGHVLESDLRRVRALTQIMATRYRDALENAVEAVRIAERAGTMVDRSRAYAVVAHPAILPLLGDEGRRMMSAWVNQVEATGDERLLIEARHLLLTDIWTRGIVDTDLLKTVDEALGKAEDYGWTRDEAALKMLRGWAEFLTGDWVAAGRSLARAKELIDRQAGVLQGYLHILLPHFRANLAMALGHLEEAQRIFEEALAKPGLHSPIWLNHDLARCLLMLGGEPAARAAMRLSLEARDRFGCIICGCQANGVAAEFYATLGDAGPAETLALEAEATARRLGHVATLVRAQRARSRLALYRGTAQDALTMARAAIDVGASFPIAQPYESGQSLALLGHAYKAAGDRAAAVETWTAAREIFSRLGAAWHMARTEEVLQEVQ